MEQEDDYDGYGYYFDDFCKKDSCNDKAWEPWNSSGSTFTGAFALVALVVGLNWKNHSKPYKNLFVLAIKVPTVLYHRLVLFISVRLFQFFSSFSSIKFVYFEMFVWKVSHEKWWKYLSIEKVVEKCQKSQTSKYEWEWSWKEENSKCFCSRRRFRLDFYRFFDNYRDSRDNSKVIPT